VSGDLQEKNERKKSISWLVRSLLTLLCSAPVETLSIPGLYCVGSGLEAMLSCLLTECVGG
jgi:hypothetical protein